MKKLMVFLGAALLVFGLVSITYAGLMVKGLGTIVSGGSGDYQLIYDTDLDITWLDYTSSYDNWYNQMAWADNLIVTMADSQSFTDWRLPTTVDGPWSWGYDGTTTVGYNITTSEMGHLFYEALGNKGYYAKDGSYPQPGWGLSNKGPFSTLQPEYYWSGSESEDNTENAWYFEVENGYQNYAGKGSNFFHALAVRSGDVSAAPIPEPATILLMASGLIGLAGFRRRFKKK